MPNTRYPKIMLHAEVNLGKRSVGGPEVSYRSCIKNDLELFSINVGGNFKALESMAKNRGM